jgi:actin-related protein
MMYNALEFEDVSNASIIFTEPIFNPKDHKFKLAELAFEKFGIDKMMLISQAYCALVSEGLTTGLVIDSGESSTSVVPIFDSRIIETAISRFEMGGRTMNDYLIRMLKHKLAFLTSFEKEIARFIKEETCFVQPESNFMDGKNIPEVDYLLPDNTKIKLQDTQYM